jgi:thioester reductase-like protein
MSKKTIFLTGGTGLVGSYLLKVFIENGHKVFCLAREKNGVDAQDRVLNILRFWFGKKTKKVIDKLVILNGDLTKINLGIGCNFRELLRKEVEVIIHCAALTEFNAPKEMLNMININGTKRIFELGLKLNREGKCERINYVSSIYISGDYKGVFNEDTFDVKQNFATPYERSKFEAERLVCRYRKHGLWIDIFRLPAIVGESSTGKTLYFGQAFYQALRILNSELLISLPCRKSYLDIAYIDDVCKSIYQVSNKSLHKNICYNLFSPKPLSVERILTLTCKILNIKIPKFVSYENFFKNNPSFVQRNLLKHNFFFLTKKSKFNSSKTNNILKKIKFTFSKHSKKRLSKLLIYAVKKGYLRKRKQTC